MEKITILTEPVDSSLGPNAVLRSLTAGLTKLNVNYNLNPKKTKEIGKTVIVLSNINALKKAIKLKRDKKICRLLAGPNLMVFSNEFNSILASPEIDICIVPSKHVLSAYIKDSPQLQDRIKIWYAGVDENYWKPYGKLKEKNAIVYYKNSSKKLYTAVLSLLKKNNWNPIKILYGKYTQENYKKTLEISRFSVFLSRSESQGISLAESWSMDVPTFVWNPGTVVISGRVFHNVSSAPYLSKETGLEWKMIEDLENILITINRRLKTFNPRKWILNNMNDVKSALTLLEIVQKISV